jgi:hypothetical protein
MRITFIQRAAGVVIVEDSADDLPLARERHTLQIKGRRARAACAGGFIGAHPVEVLPCPGPR